MAKFLLTIMIAMVASFTAEAAMEVINGDTPVGSFNRLECAGGIECTASGERIRVQSYQTQVAATATTITVDQCGSTFINSGAVQMELPEASAVIGCRLTFIVANASNFDVNPDDADQILVETNAVGDAVRNAVLGGVLTLEAISASQWVPVEVEGTWADID